MFFYHLLIYINKKSGDKQRTSLKDVPKTQPITIDYKLMGALFK